MDLLASLLALLVAAGLTRRFCDPRSRLHILDHPGERSLHSQPVPRSGGVAVLAGLLAGSLLLWARYPVGTNGALLVLATLVLALVSFLDDRYDVDQRLRILVHLLAAAFAIAAGFRPGVLELPGLSVMLPEWLTLAVIAMFIVWMINLYNFMDGMDGFAGGMTVFGFASLAILGLLQGNALFSAASGVVVGAAAGFLWFNFPPARIFMGDTGSSTLGLLAAVFILWGVRDEVFPLWLALLVFSPFIVDATVTLGLRLLRGEKVWLPHKTHYYQRLVQIGWGHRGTLLAEYCLMLSCSLSAILAWHWSVGVQLGLVVTWVIIYAALMAGVDSLERRKLKWGGR